MYFALLAYFSVESVYSKLEQVGDTVATIIVLAFPPKLSWSNLVNFESRYGINAPLPWTRLVITFPRAVNDKLILVASTNLSPVEPVLLCLSEPAKSTRLNFEPISFSVPSLFNYKDYT